MKISVNLSQLKIGEILQIGEYDYINQGSVNKGRFGKIYLVENDYCEEQLAIKWISLPRSMESQQQEFGKALEYELSILKNLKSNNIVRVFSQLVDNNYYFMEYANQGSVEELVLDPIKYQEKYSLKITSQFLLSIVCGIYQGLSQLHSLKNMNHRELSPGKILIHNGEAKILGLGYTKIDEMRSSKNKYIKASSVVQAQQQNIKSAMLIASMLLFPLERTTNVKESFKNEKQQLKKALKQLPSDLSYLINIIGYDIINTNSKKVFQPVQILSLFLELQQSTSFNEFIFQRYHELYKFDSETFLKFTPLPAPAQQYQYSSQPQSYTTARQTVLQDQKASYQQRTDNSAQLRTSSLSTSKQSAIPATQRISQKIQSQYNTSQQVTSPSYQSYQQALPIQSTSNQSYSQQQYVPSPSTYARSNTYQPIVSPSYQSPQSVQIASQSPQRVVYDYQPQEQQQPPQSINVNYPPVEIEIESGEHQITSLMKVFEQSVFSNVFHCVNQIRVSVLPQLEIFNIERTKIVKQHASKVNTLFDLKANSLLLPQSFELHIQSESSSYQEQFSKGAASDDNQSEVADQTVIEAEAICFCEQQQSNLSFEGLLYQQKQGQAAKVDEHNLFNLINFEIYDYIYEEKQLILNRLIDFKLEYPNCPYICFAFAFFADKFEFTDQQDEILSCINKCIAQKNQQIRNQALAFKAYLVTKHKLKDFQAMSTKLIKEADSEKSNSFIIMMKGRIASGVQEKIKLFENAYILNQKNYECLLSLCDLYLQQNNYEKASFSVSLIDSKDEIRAEVIERKIKCFKIKGNLAEIISYLRQTEQQYPISRRFEIDAIESYIEQHLLSEAEVLLNNSLQENFTSEELKMKTEQKHCLLLLQYEKTDRALECYEKFRSICSFNSFLCYSLYEALKAQKSEKANVYLKELLESNVDDNFPQFKAEAILLLNKKEFEKYTRQKLLEQPFNSALLNLLIKYLDEEKRYADIVEILANVTTFSLNCDMDQMQNLVYYCLRSQRIEFAASAIERYANEIIDFIPGEKHIDFFNTFYKKMFGMDEEQKDMLNTLESQYEQLGTHTLQIFKTSSNAKSTQESNKQFWFYYYFSRYLQRINKMEKSIETFLQNPLMKGGYFYLEECINSFQILVEYVDNLQDIPPNDKQNPQSLFHRALKCAYIIGSVLKDQGQQYDSFFEEYNNVSSSILELMDPNHKQKKAN